MPWKRCGLTSRLLVSCSRECIAASQRMSSAHSRSGDSVSLGSQDFGTGSISPSTWSKAAHRDCNRCRLPHSGCSARFCWAHEQLPWACFVVVALEAPRDVCDAPRYGQLACVRTLSVLYARDRAQISFELSAELSTRFIEVTNAVVSFTYNLECSRSTGRTVAPSSCEPLAVPSHSLLRGKGAKRPLFS